MSVLEWSRANAWIAVLGSALVLGGCGTADDLDEEVEQSVEEVVKCAAGTTVDGIDVSYWQGTINWPQVAGAGISFAIARVSDGDYLDTQFGANWVGMKNAGVVRGVYQFFRPGDDPTYQANILLNQVAAAGGFQAGDLPPVLDLEVLDGYSASYVVSRAQTWLAHIEQATGRKPIIYTSIGVWGSLGHPGGFGAYPLWVANWGVSCPSIPDASWSDWKIWQYTDAGTVAGINAYVDRNRFNGSYDDLLAFAGSSSGKANWELCTSDGECQSNWCGCNGGPLPMVCLPNTNYPKTCQGSGKPNWEPCAADGECQSNWCGCNGGPDMLCLPNTDYPKFCSSAGSCAGKCGGPSDGCWCDSLCTSYGDCCEDKVSVCGP